MFSPELHILKPYFLDVFLPLQITIGPISVARKCTVLRSPGGHQGSMEVPKDVPVREAYCVFSR